MSIPTRFMEMFVRNSSHTSGLLSYFWGIPPIIKGAESELPHETCRKTEQATVDAHQKKERSHISITMGSLLQ